MQRKQKAVLFRLCDLVPLCLVLLFAALLFAVPFLAKRETGAYAVLMYGDTQEKLSLRQDQAIKITANGHTLTVTVKDGTVCVSESTCRSGACRHMGKIGAVGECIVCVPARVRIEIEGQTPKEETLDAVVS